MILIMAIYYEKAFRALFVEELKELTGSPFGSTLVTTIGKAYYEAAVSELSTLDSIGVGFTQATRFMGTGVNLASEGARAAYLANQVSRAQRQKSVRLSQQKDSAGGVETTTGEKSLSGTGNGAGTDTGAGTGTGSAAATASSAAASGLSAEEEEEMKRKIERLSGHMFAVM